LWFFLEVVGVSVENFDGNGLADQPSLIYGFEKDDSGEVEIRELSRSGFGSPGPSPGDVIERDSTKSSLTERLPESELTGLRGLKYGDCGEDRPVFGCASDDGCGKPTYVGSTCASPVCERCWPSAVKRKVVRTAGKLDGLRRALYARYDGGKDIDFQHVIASLPWLLVDSENPLEHALLILKVLLEEQWDIDGFVAIFHPYRIKKEYRKDQYDHGGEAGEGEMTWKDVLNSEDPYEYLTFEPHFHLFFPAVRGSFDYLTAEAVEEESGWLFHRVTKNEKSNVSVSDLGDLVYQLAYCYSHAGVQQKGGRFELMSRMKGDLHQCYIPEGVEDELLAIFCDAAPKLLGTRFSNLSGKTCEADVSGSDGSEEDASESDESDVCEDCRNEMLDGHPLDDVWNPESEMASSDSASGSDPWPGGTLDAETGGKTAEGDGWSGEGSSSSSSGEATRAEIEAGVSEVMDSDDRETCGGVLKPIHEAAERLEDEEWCEQAEHVSGLRRAVAEWRRRSDEDGFPWTDDEDDDGYPGVVQNG
jgi:hypothetical protein